MHKRKHIKRIIVAIAIATAATVMMGGCGSRTSEMGSITSATDETYNARSILASLNYNPSNVVKLPKDYMKMEVKLDESYAVMDDQVRTYIEDQLRYSPAYEESDKEEVENGDVVNIDFTGKIDGEEFDGGSALDYFLEIGSNSFIDGFESQIVGMNVGDEKDITVTFPEDYGMDDLNGKEAVFTVKLNYIAEDATVGYDDLTDDYVKENLSTFGYTTVDEMKEAAVQQIESENQSKREEDLRVAIMDKLKEESEFNIPKNLLEDKYEEVKTNLTKQAEENNMEVDDFMQAYYQTTLDDYISDNKEDIESIFKEELILQAIVKDLRVDVTSYEFTSFLSEYSAYYGMDSKELTESMGGQDKAILIYAEDKAYNLVANSVTVVDADSVDQAEDSKTNTENIGDINPSETEEGNADPDAKG